MKQEIRFSTLLEGAKPKSVVGSRNCGKLARGQNTISWNLTLQDAFIFILSRCYGKIGFEIAENTPRLWKMEGGANIIY